MKTTIAETNHTHILCSKVPCTRRKKNIPLLQIRRRSKKRRRTFKKARPHILRNRAKSLKYQKSCSYIAPETEISKLPHTLMKKQKIQKTAVTSFCTFKIWHVMLQLVQCTPRTFQTFQKQPSQPTLLTWKTRRWHHSVLKRATFAKMSRKERKDAAANVSQAPSAKWVCQWSLLG